MSPHFSHVVIHWCCKNAQFIEEIIMKQFCCISSFKPLFYILNTTKIVFFSFVSFDLFACFPCDSRKLMCETFLNRTHVFDKSLHVHDLNESEEVGGCGVCFLTSRNFVKEYFFTFSNFFEVDLRILRPRTFTPQRNKHQGLQVSKMYFLRTQHLIYP